LEELLSTKQKVYTCLDNFDFSLAAEELSSFTWDKLADWYLEVAKIEKDKDEILIYILKNILMLWHPFVPYVTETIWSHFADDLLLVAQWPKTELITNKGSDFKLIQDLVVAIRNARSENKVEPSRKVKAVIYGHSQTSIIKNNAELIKNLKTGIEEITIVEKGEIIEGAITITQGEIDICLLGAVDEAKEKQRLIKEKENLEKMIASLTSRLSNEEFTAKAPESIVEAEKAKLNSYSLELDKISKLIISL
jgi:valyl-tRNA synthetase